MRESFKKNRFNFFGFKKRSRYRCISLKLISGKIVITSELQPNVVTITRELKFVSSFKPINDKIKCEYSKCQCRFNSFIWINKEKKIIWVEIPKVASRSMYRALNIGSLNWIDQANVLFYRIMSENLNGLSFVVESSRYREVSQMLIDRINNSDGMSEYPLYKNRDNTGEFKMFIGNKKDLYDYKEYIMLSIIRDPIKRFLSNYRMFTQKNFRILQLKEMNINIEQMSSVNDFSIQSKLCLNHHWEPQYKFISDFEGFKTKLFKLESGMQLINKYLESKGLSKIDSTKNSTIKTNNSNLSDGLYNSIVRRFEKDIKLYNEI